MKRVVFAIAGLACMTAAVAHAQTQAGPFLTPAPTRPGLTLTPAPALPAPAAAPAAPARSCLLVTKTGEQYSETPLAGFDPALTSAPLPGVTAAGAVMVVCNRTTIIPEISDYRVLTELRLPLAIRAGQKSLFLGASGGKLQVGMPDGQATPADTAAVQDRLDQMEAAMQAKPPAK